MKKEPRKVWKAEERRYDDECCFSWFYVIAKDQDEAESIFFGFLKEFYVTHNPGKDTVTKISHVKNLIKKYDWRLRECPGLAYTGNTSGTKGDFTERKFLWKPGKP